MLNWNIQLNFLYNFFQIIPSISNILKVSKTLAGSVVRIELLSHILIYKIVLLMINGLDLLYVVKKYNCLYLLLSI